MSSAIVKTERDGNVMMSDGRPLHTRAAETPQSSLRLRVLEVDGAFGKGQWIGVSVRVRKYRKIQLQQAF